MEEFELVPLLNGVMSLRCLETRETFHPGIGPVAEAQRLHVDQQKLVERCRASSDFHLWDVGLGAGANALTAIRSLMEADCGPVLVQSFDKSLRPMEFALDHAEELGYLLGFESQIRELLQQGTVQISPHITWNLHGDFFAAIAQSLRAPDAIFYDPYSAKGHAEMWSLGNFARIRAVLSDHRLCLLSNYTASTYLRVTLLLAGFYVGVGCAIDKKTQTTLASNQLDALENPLDRHWLEKRVRVSHSAAPLRLVPHQIAPISETDYEALQRHPQFAR